MEIKGLDYNTQRKALLMPEYGREIQKMVDYAVSLPTKAERQRCAETIVRQMETRIPQIRENANYKQTLWDHLYLMSQQQLDIDWPYDMNEAERILSKPQPMKARRDNAPLRLRHYGRLVEELFEKLKQMPEGKERDELVRLTANQMKRDLMTWGHGSMDDEKVADDLARFTDGRIQLDLSKFRFERGGNGNVLPADSGKRKRRR